MFSFLYEIQINAFLKSVYQSILSCKEQKHHNWKNVFKKNIFIYFHKNSQQAGEVVS